MRQAHHAFVQPVGPHPNYFWSKPRFEVILVNTGRNYIYASTEGPLIKLIERLEEANDGHRQDWEIMWLRRLLDKKISVKEVKRAIRLKLLVQRDDGVYRNVNKELDKGFGRGRRFKWSTVKEGYTLKQDSRRKSYIKRRSRFSSSKHGINPAKDCEPPVDYGFDQISNNAFGHPRRKFSLKNKRMQPGYRRSAMNERAARLLLD